MANVISPCKDCPDRHVGCHGTCKRYKEWDTANRERRERRQNIEMIDNYILGMKSTGKERARRKKGKG